MRNGTRFVLIGLPGSGKSMVGHVVAEHCGGVFVEEDPADFALLSFALNPGKVAALSQIEFLLAKAQDEVASNSRMVWQEIDTRYCHLVWSKALRRAGTIDTDELGILNRMGAFLDAICPRPDAMISLELERPELERRICRRGREHEVTEGNLDPGFGCLLKALQHEHRVFVESESVPGVPVYRVDASSSPLAIVEDVLVRTGTI